MVLIKFNINKYEAWVCDPPSITITTNKYDVYLNENRNKAAIWDISSANDWILHQNHKENYSLVNATDAEIRGLI